jgi:signal transduction histidine kinase
MQRSLAWRIVVTMLVSGLFGSVVALVLGVRALGDGFGAQIEPLLIGRFDRAEARACAAAPAAWTMTVWPMWQMRGYAYDAATHRSANPAAPPLREDLVGRLGDARSVIDLRGRDRTGALVFRAAAPCDLVQITWRNPVEDRRIGPVVVGSAIGSALFASLLGLTVIVLPLVRRIRRLGAAASQVGEPEGYVGYAAHRRQAGDELDAVGRVLDRAHVRIRDDARQLADQRDALERHLTRVAHDLRTPLTSLQIGLEYAADRVDDPAAREAIAGALRDAVYVAGLTANLRLASQLRSGWNPADDVAAVDLSELVQRIVERARILARRRQIALEVSVPDAPVRVVGNAVAIEQALANVVDNAVAYGDRQGHVAVVLRASGTGFALEISDDGPGVDPADLPRLGQDTFRSDEARQRDPRGSGLGLAITAEVCARLDWTLEFAALEPRGLVVRLTGRVRDA